VEGPVCGTVPNAYPDRPLSRRSYCSGGEGECLRVDADARGSFEMILHVLVGDNDIVRLYLSSYQLGDHPEARAWFGAKSAWVIMNAFDGVDPQLRRVETQRQLTNLASIGLTAYELDLRAHDAESLTAQFGEPDFVWVRGGNVCTLRAALVRVVRHSLANLR
jgi:hypothetical protein